MKPKASTLTIRLAVVWVTLLLVEILAQLTGMIGSVAGVVAWTFLGCTVTFFLIYIGGVRILDHFLEKQDD